MTEGDPELVREAAELLLAAERPIIYAGGGILKSRAADALRELAERTGIPVVTTLMARGCFPDSHPLCLGMPGMHGNYTAVTSMQRSDLLIALGSRFDDRVTGRVDAFAPEAKIIHVDIDPAELNKVRHADVAIAGDCRLVIDELLAALDGLGLGHSDATRGGRGGAPSDAVSGAPAAAGSMAASFPRERLIPWRASSASGSGATRWSTNRSRAPVPSSPSSCWRPSVTPRPTTPSWLRAWASTRCSPPSGGSSTIPTPGSTPGAWAPWASPCRPPSVPRWAGPTRRCGRWTATAASR